MGSIKSASLTQTAGSGETLISGAIDTNGPSGINLSGNVFTIDAVITSSNGGPCSIDHTGLLTLIAEPSTLLTGPFTETGSGNVALAGNLHAEDSNITFTNPITLIADTILNSDGGGDIVLMSPVDGSTALDLIAGTGNIYILADIGSATPVNSVTINTAHNVETESIAAGWISQITADGLTDFHGALTTTASQGIVLTGNEFTFENPVSTEGNGPVSITNSGLLSIDSTAPFTLSGPFSQLGAGPVLLCADITCTNGNPILFTGPVSLCGPVSLSSQGMTFQGTVNGSQDLTLRGGSGAIQFQGGSRTIPAFRNIENFVGKFIQRQEPGGRFIGFFRHHRPDCI